jgi:hypothetical protein
MLKLAVVTALLVPTNAATFSVVGWEIKIVLLLRSGSELVVGAVPLTVKKTLPKLFVVETKTFC